MSKPKSRTLVHDVIYMFWWNLHPKQIFYSLKWHVTWSFHSIFFPTIMLLWWGGDRAVQSQCYLPSSHCHLTSPLFHHKRLIFAVVCLSSTLIALLSHCNATSTLLYNYLLILPYGLTANILQLRCQDYKCTAVKKLCK